MGRNFLQIAGFAPVAQWIEQRFPKPRAQVRFLPGALSDKPLATAIQGKMSLSSGPWLQVSSTSGLPPTDDPGAAEPFGKQRPCSLFARKPNKWPRARVPSGAQTSAVLGSAMLKRRLDERASRDCSERGNRATARHRKRREVELESGAPEVARVVSHRDWGAPP
jgi:hypothetical protein